MNRPQQIERPGNIPNGGPAIIDAAERNPRLRSPRRALSKATPLVVIGVALLATAVSYATRGSSIRLVLVPAIIFCGLSYPAVLPLFIFAAYLTPEVLLQGSSSLTSMPWLILLAMTINFVGRFWRPSRLAVPLKPVVWFLLFSVFVVAAEFNAGPNNIVDVNRYWAYPLFFLVLWQYRTEFDRKVVTLVLIGCAGVLAAWVLWRFLHAASAVAFARGEGLDAADPNYLSRWIDLGVVPVFAYLLHRQKGAGRKFLKIMAMGFIVLAGAALICMASRGSAAALVAAICVMVLLTVRHDRRIIFAAFVVLAMVIMAPVLWHSEIFSTYRERFTQGPLWQQGGRLQLLVDAYTYWVNAPLFDKLFGGGTGTTFAAIHMHTHNNFMEMLLDYGLFGLVAFVGLLYAAWRNVSHQVGYFRTVSTAWLVLLTISCIDLSPFYFIWAWQILALVIPLPKGAEKTGLRGKRAAPIA